METTAFHPWEGEQEGLLEKSREVANQGISLRPFDLSDIDDFMVWASDDRVSRFCSWDTFTSKNDLLRYVTEIVLPHPWFRAICLDGRPVGAISVALNTGNDRCRGELGYALASLYWGRGIVSTAVKMVTGSIFREVPELERLEAVVDVGNVGSQRVLEKAGFQREGVLSTASSRGRRATWLSTASSLLTLLRPNVDEIPNFFSRWIYRIFKRVRLIPS